MKNVIIFVDELDFGGISRIAINLNSILKDKFNTKILCNKNNYSSINVDMLNEQDNFIKKARAITKYINSNKVDLIITNAWKENIIVYLGMLMSKKKLKIVQILHYDYSQLKLNGSNVIKNMVKKMLIKFSFNVSNRCISVSLGACNELNEKIKLKRNFLNLYNPVIDRNKEPFNKAEIKNLVQKKNYSIACIGWIRAAKGQKTILEAMELTKNEKFSLTLHIIGGVKEEEYKLELMELIKDYSLENNVKFHGEVVNPYNILNSMDALVVSSKCEALPTVIIEAISLGIPVISSNCKHGPYEILEGGKVGMLYETGNAKQLTSCMIKLFTDEGLYCKYSTRGIEKSIDFEYDKIREIYSRFLNEVLNEEY
ncbi:glycosyltransferase [Clostridium sp.]|uniref:glycosyltransferase n=1 Tax=Clostridium sp. TaxID=1506 RepID=UPI0032165220